jgi:glucose-1-phosphate adenylyltransferase
MLEHEPGHDFGRELIPGALGTYKVKPYLYRGYWADVGTIESFTSERHARPAGLTLPLLGPGPSDLHAPATSARLPVPEARVRDSIVSDGCYLAGCDIDNSSSACAWRPRRLAHLALGPARRRLLRVRRSAEGTLVWVIGADVVLDRVIVDKNARIGDARASSTRRGSIMPTGKAITSAAGSSW